jgi:hypothetical protein
LIDENISPALQKYLYYQEMLGTKDPISSGAQAGIDAAHQSMQMNPKQARRASGLAMLNFLAHKQNPEPGTGFGGAIQGMIPGLLPAAEAYKEEEDNAQRINHILMKNAQAAIDSENQRRENMAAKLMDYEERKARHDEEMDFERERFEETKRYHDLLADRKKGEEIPETGNAYLDQLPPLDKSSYSKFTQKKRAEASLLSEISNIEKHLSEFEKLSKDSIFDPFNPLHSKYTNMAKDVLSYSGSKKLTKERTARKQLDSALRQFNLEIERALKGGVVSERMAKRFEEKEVLPSINEGLPDLKAKLEDIKKHIKTEHDATSLTLKYRRLIDPVDLERMEEPEEEEETSFSPDLSQYSTEQIKEMIRAKKAQGA